LAATAMLESASAQSELSHEGRETSNRSIALEQIPEAARQTLLAQAGAHSIRELEEKVVDGATVYEIEIRPDGREVEVVVASDGKLVRIKHEGAAEKSLVANLSRRRDRRRSFKVDKKNLGPVSYNPYFPLTPGMEVHLTDGHETVVFSVLDETKIVDGVETRVVQEYETKGGQVVEISRNYFATDRIKGDVYYFGEDVDVYENGKVVGSSGAWLSGVDGAKFGLIMPGRPDVGDQFYLEMAPGAVERVEISSIDVTFETPVRSFDAVIHAREFDELDGGNSQKWYAPGIGMVGDDAKRAFKVEMKGR
jgi:hypothetical protein